MKKTMMRFVSVIAVFFILLLVCYGLARVYLVHDADRAERVLKELETVKIGDSEEQVLPMLQQYGKCQRVPEITKFDKTDYECLVDMGPSGIYYVVDSSNTGAFYRMTRWVLSALNPRLRRAIGLRRWNVYGRVGFKDKQATVVSGAVMVEGSNEWLSGDWRLMSTIPEPEIDRFVTTAGISWPHGNRYLVGWEKLIAMEIKNGGGEGASSWITPSATEDERRSAHGFKLQCLTSRSACQTVCDLYPAAQEYASSGTWNERREACSLSSSNSYW